VPAAFEKLAEHFRSREAEVVDVFPILEHLTVAGARRRLN
jgi:hypothetical protein